MKKLSIVADENIPCLAELFGDIADITCLPGRRIEARDLKDADALLVRSVTKVGPSLLSMSGLSFVGSCTIGTDHVDLEYLSSKGIAFANAPGCNAAAVADYVLTAIFHINPSIEYWQSKTVGIVGLGEVGGRLQKRLERTGIPTRCYDPYKPQARDSFRQVLACDVVTLHVPLTRTGEHKTHHLIGAAELQQLRPGTLLINTSRGPVIDNAALSRAIGKQPLRVVLDVYEDEPSPDTVLLEAVDIATAHIAGYSLHGKIRGSLQVAEAMYQHFSISRKIPDLLGNLIKDVRLKKGEGLQHLLAASYDIAADSRDFIRQYGAGSDRAGRAAAFDKYRKDYQNRYEWSHIDVVSEGDLPVFVDMLGFGKK